MVDRGHHRHLRALIAVVAQWACVSWGCASPRSALRAEATYVGKVEARVKAAQEEARFVLRHNPAAACGCPPFELKLGTQWQRVEIIGGEADDPTVLALAEISEQPPAVGQRDRRVFGVEGQLEERVALCGRGGLYVSLVPTAFLGEVVAPPGAASP